MAGQDPSGHTLTIQEGPAALEAKDYDLTKSFATEECRVNPGAISWITTLFQEYM